ncbi:MAG: cysteine hydrolase [Desulfobacteraceae bacterium]|nr:MAG: cysteine hydrolase [Desulfobacteraceae bacterium]
MKRGLIIVDMQNDYFPGGKMELVGMPSAAQHAQGVLEEFRSRNMPVFHIQHISLNPGATFFLPETQGAAIHPSVAPSAAEPVIRKHFPNSFRDTPLLKELQQRDIGEVVICGAMSHMCIDATVRAAFDLGLRCNVVSDACATRDLKFGQEVVPAAQVHAAFMAALSAPFARVVEADKVAPLLG